MQKKSREPELSEAQMRVICGAELWKATSNSEEQNQFIAKRRLEEEDYDLDVMLDRAREKLVFVMSRARRQLNEERALNEKLVAEIDRLKKELWRGWNDTGKTIRSTELWAKDVLAACQQWRDDRFDGSAT